METCPDVQRRQSPTLTYLNPVNTLILFVKNPQPGTVKTRLTPWLTPEEAAALYRAFILDTLVLSDQPGSFRRMIAFAPGEGLAALKTFITTPDIVFFPQTGATLGDRMRTAIEKAFSDGARRVAIIGSDSPILPSGYLTDAFDALLQKDIVIGPATDGGYYLIGAVQNHRTVEQLPHLFSDIPWSTNAVYDRTVSALQKNGLSYAALPAWADVDEPADILRLRDQIAALRRSGEPALGVHTERLLQTFSDRLEARNG